MVIWIDGPMGVGKTSVGKIIAEKLGSSIIVDADRYFLDPNLCGFNVLLEGGGVFPQTNRRFLKKLKEKIQEKDSKDSYIVVIMSLNDLICKTELYDALLLTDYSELHIFLDANDNVLETRIKNDTERDDKKLALDSVRSSHEFFKENFPASVVIDTTHRTPPAIADEIIAIVLPTLS